MSLSEKFIVPLARFSYDNLPAEVIEKTKVCILHALACTFAGLDERWSTAAREMTAELQPAGTASIWFRPQRSNMADAAFINATAAQSILHEDIHRDSNAHPGIIVIPAAIATAEARRCDGKRLLAAVAAGYEMMGRIGRGTVCPGFGNRGFRPTSIIGVFGSAMASGLLANLSTEQHSNAFGLAANFASGINEWAITGSDDLYFQNGMASRNGVVAAELARRGVTAPVSVLEGISGFCNAYDFSRENLEKVDCEDGRYVIMDVLFKPAPACALVQTTAQAALDAAADGIKPDQIASGKIITFALGKNYAGCDNAGPYDKLLQARMSNQYNFAASLVKGTIANANYYQFDDPAIANLAGKLTMEIDEQFSSMFPERQPVRIELTLKNGETRSYFREEPVYLGQDEVIRKFDDIVAPTYGKKTVAQLIDTVFHLEDCADLTRLGQLLTKA